MAIFHLPSMAFMHYFKLCSYLFYHRGQIISTASALLAWLVLHFLTSVLLNIVDAVFVCYAFDRDCCMCSQPLIHDIYAHLPGCGGNPEAASVDPMVLSNPDGSMYYAPPHPSAPSMLYNYSQYNYSSSGASIDRGYNPGSYYPPVFPQPSAPPGRGGVWGGGGNPSDSGVAEGTGGFNLGATGTTAEYWQNMQRFHPQLAPGPSPLFYSPSFNADQVCWYLPGIEVNLFTPLGYFRLSSLCTVQSHELSINFILSP